MLQSTPVETHLLHGVSILVKREDLCCPDGPPFSKMRGVYAHLANRPESVIGVLDTFHSKAGWAVAHACLELGKQCINFWPQYKKDRGIQSQQRKAETLGADLVALTAGRSAILFHRAKAYLAEEHPGSYMMPNALKLDESVTENAQEARRTASSLPGKGTLLISISSGTVAAGVIKGLEGALGYDIVLHMGYSRSEGATRAYMERMSGWNLARAQYVDEGYGYADHAKGVEAPFPCNQYYDLKAWKWLGKPGILEELKSPIVFWNIGD